MSDEREVVLPPQTLHHVHLVNADLTKGVLCGGSYDQATAVAIACAVFQVQQSYSPSIQRRVAVWDDTDTIVAYIGSEGEVV